MNLSICKKEERNCLIIILLVNMDQELLLEDMYYL